MKPLDHYRIVDRMGWFYPEQEHIGFRGRKKWKQMWEEFSSMAGDSCRRYQQFKVREEAERWLAARIAEDRLNRELKARGPVVVREL